MSNTGRERREEAEWQLVSERNRCPICDASHGCHRDLEGAFACCARRPSDWPLTSGEWLHRLESVETIDVVAAADLTTATLDFAPRSPMSGPAQ